jgi:FMN phosphatase YigB (HAD superfamily)
MIKETSMIKEILDKTNYSTKDTVFFDDMEWNTIPVKNIGIDSHLITSNLGILELFFD